MSRYTPLRARCAAMAIVVAAGIACRPASDSSDPPAKRLTDAPTPTVTVGNDSVSDAGIQLDSTSGTLKVRGPHFELILPPGSRLKKGRTHPAWIPAVEILGIQAPNPEFAPGPSFILWVREFANPKRTPLTAWGDSIWTARKGGPDDFTGLGPPRPVTIAGVSGLQFEPYCGDCDPYEVYLAGEESVVLLAYMFDPVSLGRPPEGSEAIVSSILASFRWRP